MKVSLASLVFFTLIMWGLAEFQYSLSVMYFWDTESFKTHSVMGTIVSKRVVPTSGKTTNNLVRLTYFYEIDGAIYRSNICSITAPVVRERYAERFADGGFYQVFYDPNNYSRAVLAQCHPDDSEVNGIRILVLSFLFALFVSLREKKITFWSR